MNKVILMGRLTADVELGQTGKGKDARSYGNFTVAVRDGVDADGEKRTQFIRCVAFGKIAEVLNKFTGKGQPICVCGRLHVSSYEDENDVTHWTTSVVVEDFDLIGSANKDEDEEDEKQKKNTKKYSKK